MAIASLDARTGRISDFDSDRGLGTIQSDEDSFPFHCTAIADGSRAIDVGTDVRFVIVAGRAGRWEAGNIEPAGGS